MKKCFRVEDNIHGAIELPYYVVDVINTKEFQRLRNLKQLGVSNLVFPGAVHTR
jgi:HD superfamily phosphohydrolase